MRHPDLVGHLVRMTVVEIDVAMGLHTGMPDAVTAIDVLPVEVEELLACLGQILTHHHMTGVSVHDTDAILVFVVDIKDELVRELGGSGLLN